LTEEKKIWLKFWLSFLVSSSSDSLYSIDSQNLCNIDPNDPNVVYPPFYIAPPELVPGSPNSIISTNYDESFYVNGMPSNFRGYFQLFLICILNLLWLL
jgi:hypothetical protein